MHSVCFSHSLTLSLFLFPSQVYDYNYNINKINNFLLINYYVRNKHIIRTQAETCKQEIGEEEEAKQSKTKTKTKTKTNKENCFLIFQ
jgi:hypothetical protein